MIFNPWRPYPMWLPKKDGWYRCTVGSFDADIERKVMDLYFDVSTESWRDNRRQQVFDGYKVYKSGREALEYNRMYSDSLCVRNDVVAWKKIEKPHFGIVERLRNRRKLCRWFKRKEKFRV